MNLLEYQAKQLLKDYGLPTPASWLVRTGGEIPGDLVFPVVAKSQVPVGGRGKLGGIQTIDTSSNVEQVIADVLALKIKGHTPSAVLLEEKLIPRRELYISLRLNRDTRALEWLASPHGGVEIESHSDSVKAFADAPELLEELSKYLETSKSALAPLLDGIKQCVLNNDLLLLEINPLIEQANETLVCADAKVLVDDSARFRHPELPWPPSEGNHPVPLGGSIGCIANGAGMAMSTMDTIVSLGGKPANFLDIGGGTGEKEFVVALKQIMDMGGVDSIIVNIFAGISRCDEIARGIIAAGQQLESLPPLFIRLEGTNRDIAAQLLDEAHIPIEPDLKTCVQKAMAVTS